MYETENLETIFKQNAFSASYAFLEQTDDSNSNEFP